MGRGYRRVKRGPERTTKKNTNIEIVPDDVPKNYTFEGMVSEDIALGSHAYSAEGYEFVSMALWAPGSSAGGRNYIHAKPTEVGKVMGELDGAKSKSLRLSKNGSPLVDRADYVDTMGQAFRYKGGASMDVLSVKKSGDFYAVQAREGRYTRWRVFYDGKSIHTGNMSEGTARTTLREAKNLFGLDSLSTSAASRIKLIKATR